MHSCYPHPSRLHTPAPKGALLDRIWQISCCAARRTFRTLARAVQSQMWMTSRYRRHWRDLLKALRTSSPPRVRRTSRGRLPRRGFAMCCCKLQLWAPASRSSRSPVCRAQPTLLKTPLASKAPVDPCSQRWHKLPSHTSTAELRRRSPTWSGVAAPAFACARLQRVPPQQRALTSSRRSMRPTLLGVRGTWHLAVSQPQLLWPRRQCDSSGSPNHRSPPVLHRSPLLSSTTAISSQRCQKPQGHPDIPDQRKHESEVVA